MWRRSLKRTRHRGSPCDKLGAAPRCWYGLYIVHPIVIFAAPLSRPKRAAFYMTTKTLLPSAINPSALTAPDAVNMPVIASPPPPGPAKKLYIKTFGCQMNAYDSDKMAEVLHASEGFMRTEDPEEADVIVFNTCSVREKAQEKVFSDLGRVRHLKKKGVLIGVGGCVASQEGEAILQRAPYVDFVFGPQTLHRLPALMQARRREQRAQIDISFPEIEKFDHLPPARVEGPSAFVSIMEGCSRYCSYCVVPYTRGEEVHRPLSDILQEIAHLCTLGVKEITLLGQNVNAWQGLRDKQSGADRDNIADFAELLHAVAAFAQIERIRYTTSHPRAVTSRLIQAHADIAKLAGHLHLPVQHASDTILAAMKRAYSIVEYKAMVRRLRAARPDLALSSDFIVGFPGETEADFLKMLALIEELQFDSSFSFIYSPRPGTPAASMHDDTPHPVKLARLQRLQAALEANVQRFSLALVGSRRRILVTGTARKNADELSGRTECNRIVNFAVPAHRHAQLIGQMADVDITAAHAHSLRGELR